MKSVSIYSIKIFLLLPLMCLLVARLPAQSAFEKKELPKSLEPLLESHCYDCHDDTSEKGDLNLYDMPFDLSSQHKFKIWARVFDRVKDGEMPPKKKKRPAESERVPFLNELNQMLLAADRADIAKRGRVRGRRLTRVEYEHTVQDLLGVRTPLKQNLPAEESDAVFASVAESQQLSHFHLDKYLKAADLALTEAFTRLRGGGVKYRKDYSPKLLTRQKKGNYRGPEFRGGKAYSWAVRTQFAGRMTETRVPETGWYRVTIRNLMGVNPGADRTVWGTMHTGSGYSNEPLLYLARTLEGVAKPKDVVCDVWIRKGHMLVIKPNEGNNELARNVRGGAISYKGKNLLKQGVAGLGFDGITIERIYLGESREGIQHRLLPGIPFSEGKPETELGEKEIKRLVLNFAARAFRRPVTAKQISSYHELALASYEQSGEAYQALHSAYRAILCSPRMLTFVESPGKLDGYAIASRLSYFLWSSFPDEELLALAARGVLRDPKVLRQQVRRMLADKKSERFIAHFTDQWLNLKEIDFTTPDPRRFKQFDEVLQDSMVKETRAFLRKLIDENLSVKNFIRAEFAMLDTRLQTHYGLGDVRVVEGKGLQKVELKPGQRSGLVTQASILKVTADGSVTSPVLRGVWIGERILGLHIPPPPPNVGAIEPDIRGAKNIRDQLAKHSNSESCAACHLKIDPQGFALERYNPIGRPRQFYGKVKKSVKVDDSGITPEGDRFAGIEQWKDIYAERPEMLARAFAEQLLTYGTGASIRFSDRSELDKIVSDVKTHQYGIRSIIKAVVTSERFLSK
ncbi:MAG: DUF1592 domain-containing protein [Akkermansiaceae bacterium]